MQPIIQEHNEARNKDEGFNERQDGYNEDHSRMNMLPHGEYEDDEDYDESFDEDE